MALENNNIWEPGSEAEHTAVQSIQLMEMYGANKQGPGNKSSSSQF